MSGYINVTLFGALGKDPEVRATQSGKKVASFSVAVDQGYGDNKKTEWISVVTFDKLAEIAEKWLKKGKTVALSGTLQTRSWESDGRKHYRTEVIARDLSFMDSGSRSGGEQRERQAPAPRQQAAPQQRPSAPVQEDSFDDSEEIPF